VYSEIDVEDVDSSQEDHLYDAARYVMMERRIAPPKTEAKKRPEWDPLELYEPKYNGY
jgi:hypothetical protein